jgi:hypothetical protein
MKKSIEIYIEKSRKISKEDMDITFAPRMRKLILKMFVEKYIISNANVTANSNKKEGQRQTRSNWEECPGLPVGSCNSLRQNR